MFLDLAKALHAFDQLIIIKYLTDSFMVIPKHDFWWFYRFSWGLK